MYIECFKFKSDSNEVDNERLRQNMLDAVDAYVSRVNGSPCGDTTIHLFPGPESKTNQEFGEKVRISLHGKKEKKDTLKKDFPHDCAYIQTLLQVQKNNTNANVPSRYIFNLACCYKKGCPHPLCKKGRPKEDLHWYPGGPSVSYVPFPVPDPARPYGMEEYTSCKGEECTGHFLPRRDVIAHQMTC